MAGSSSVASTSIMDIDGYKKSVLAPPGTVPSVHVNAHPLVLLNISEHWTRTRAQNGRPQTVFGAVIGKQTGRLVELLNSYELVTCEVGGSVIIDDAYYQMKSEQFKQVFPDFDMLGWYSTGEDPTDADIKVTFLSFTTILFFTFFPVYYLFL
ncbi:hypothetical protein EB796_003518 [Bugula neritina]|uniref:COP9 signalosome complex subunit 6 n=1 Tax=Bugula neritina TaxID=10212 RepID=A0A7J7KL75_BUGNE|nr:hypothetical protein EB796_003518 [Bugula neritina]